MPGARSTETGGEVVVGVLLEAHDSGTAQLQADIRTVAWARERRVRFILRRSHVALRCQTKSKADCSAKI